MLGIVCSIIVLGTSLALAGPVEPARPYDFVEGLDGDYVEIDHPFDGTTVAAWTLRARGETDIAVAVRDADGLWSKTGRLGLADGLDQREPSLAADAGGNVYLAYGDEAGRISLRVLPAGERAWLAHDAAGARVRGESPALRTVGQRLVLAFTTKEGVSILDLPLWVAPIRGNMNEGPDPVGGRPDPVSDGEGTKEDPLGEVPAGGESLSMGEPGSSEGGD
jgi:hypothetical protein